MLSLTRLVSYAHQWGWGQGEVNTSPLRVGKGGFPEGNQVPLLKEDKMDTGWSKNQMPTLVGASRPSQETEGQ